MQLSVANLRSLVEKAYISHAKAAFGDAGAKAIRSVLDCIHLVYGFCPPEDLKGSLTLLIGIGASPSSPATSHLGALATLASEQEVGDFLLGVSANQPHAVIEICADRTFRALALANSPDPSLLAASAVVYRYEARTDRILAGTHDDYVEKVLPLLYSSFAIPTKAALEDVLAYYADAAKFTKCYILEEVWEEGVDGPRLVLRNKPEATLRNSLCQAVNLLLREANARPEQNTDESKPIDIRVDWFGARTSALIEIKWLGRSVARESATADYTDYGPRRAQEGAEQLEDYLEREVRFSGANSTTGYLVVFDARRRNVDGPTVRLSREDALAFENSDIDYDPDYSQIRPDFAPPIRYFMMPRQDFFTDS